MRKNKSTSSQSIQEDIVRSNRNGLYDCRDADARIEAPSSPTPRRESQLNWGWPNEQWTTLTGPRKPRTITSNTSYIDREPVQRSSGGRGILEEADCSQRIDQSTTSSIQLALQRRQLEKQVRLSGNAIEVRPRSPVQSQGGFISSGGRRVEGYTGGFTEYGDRGGASDAHGGFRNHIPGRGLGDGRGGSRGGQHSGGQHQGIGLCSGKGKVVDEAGGVLGESGRDTRGRGGRGTGGGYGDIETASPRGSLPSKEVCTIRGYERVGQGENSMAWQDSRHKAGRPLRPRTEARQRVMNYQQQMLSGLLPIELPMDTPQNGAARGGGAEYDRDEMSVPRGVARVRTPPGGVQPSNKAQEMLMRIANDFGPSSDEKMADIMRAGGGSARLDRSGRPFWPVPPENDSLGDEYQHKEWSGRTPGNLGNTAAGAPLFHGSKQATNSMWSDTTHMMQEGGVPRGHNSTLPPAQDAPSFPGLNVPWPTSRRESAESSRHSAVKPDSRASVVDRATLAAFSEGFNEALRLTAQQVYSLVASVACRRPDILAPESESAMEALQKLLWAMQDMVNAKERGNQGLVGDANDTHLQKLIVVMLKDEHGKAVRIESQRMYSGAPGGGAASHMSGEQRAEGSPVRSSGGRMERVEVEQGAFDGSDGAIAPSSDTDLLKQIAAMKDIIPDLKVLRQQLAQGGVGPGKDAGLAFPSGPDDGFGLSARYGGDEHTTTSKLNTATTPPLDLSQVSLGPLLAALPNAFPNLMQQLPQSDAPRPSQVPIEPPGSAHTSSRGNPSGTSNYDAPPQGGRGSTKRTEPQTGKKSSEPVWQIIPSDAGGNAMLTPCSQPLKPNTKPTTIDELALQRRGRKRIRSSPPPAAAGKGVGRQIIGTQIIGAGVVKGAVEGGGWVGPDNGAQDGVSFSEVLRSAITQGHTLGVGKGAGSGKGQNKKKGDGFKTVSLAGPPGKGGGEDGVGEGSVVAPKRVRRGRSVKRKAREEWSEDGVWKQVEKGGGTGGEGEECEGASDGVKGDGRGETVKAEDCDNYQEIVDRLNGGKLVKQSGLDGEAPLDQETGPGSGGGSSSKAGGQSEGNRRIEPVQETTLAGHGRQRANGKQKSKTEERQSGVGLRVNVTNGCNANHTKAINVAGWLCGMQAGRAVEVGGLGESGGVMRDVRAVKEGGGDGVCGVLGSVGSARSGSSAEKVENGKMEAWAKLSELADAAAWAASGLG